MRKHVSRLIQTVPALVGFALLSLAGCGGSDGPAAPTGPTAPADPSGLDAARLSETSIQLTWADNADNETGYRITRQAYGGTGPEVTIATVTANATSYTDALAEPEAVYTYRVRAFNDGGDSALQETAPGSTLASCVMLYAGIGQPGLGHDGVSQYDAQFYYPIDISFSPSGQLYIVDWNNHRIRTFGKQGLATVLGTGILGDAPAGGLGSQTPINHPTHLNFDAAGNLIVSAWHNSKVIEIDKTTGIVSNFVGDGVRRYTGDGLPALQASVNLPSSTAYDAQGRLYISDQENQLIRRLELDGTVSHIAGLVTPGGLAGQSGFSGDGGPATEAMLFSRGGQAADPQMRLTIGPDGRLYVCDSGNNRVRVIDLTTGIINTYAGNGGLGDYNGDGGPATDANMFQPCDVAFGPDGDLYIADTYNQCIRKVDTETHIITTVVGVGKQRSNAVANGPFDGTGVAPTQARLYRPYGIAFDPKGRLWIADSNNSRILVVTF